MVAPGLTEAQVSRLMEFVVSEFREVPLEAPLPIESETAYTRRCLVSLVRGVLARLAIEGLVDAGIGSAPVQPVPLFGLLFFPDLTVTFHGRRILAFEVKFLGATGRQYSVSTALGQTYLYQQAGYRRAGTLLLDVANLLSDDDVKHAEDVCRSASIEVVVRRKAGSSFLAHPR